MRKAKQIWEAYRDNANYQDYMETALASLVAAGGQAIFTDMGADEIAISTGLGAAAALAMRPGMASIGQAIGRPIDKRFPGMNDIVDRDPMMASMMFGSPGNLRYLEKNFKDEAGQALQGLAKAKYNQNFVAPDGRERGLAEGMLGSYGRMYGDNLAQGAVAITTPFIFDKMGKESVDERKARNLREQLAELEAKQ